MVFKAATLGLAAEAIYHDFIQILGVLGLNQVKGNSIWQLLWDTCFESKPYLTIEFSVLVEWFHDLHFSRIRNTQAPIFKQSILCDRPVTWHFHRHKFIHEKPVEYWVSLHRKLQSQKICIWNFIKIHHPSQNFCFQTKDILWGLLLGL